ncbi:unnamed protein product [Amoebophrya sp. A120]|nr:unnamed protein product [Amoebophrya sp. A120]|eukprot:GSA120T00009979001.1
MALLPATFFSAVASSCSSSRRLFLLLAIAGGTSQHFLGTANALSMGTSKLVLDHSHATATKKTAVEEAMNKAGRAGTKKLGASNKESVNVVSKVLSMNKAKKNLQEQQALATMIMGQKHETAEGAKSSTAVVQNKKHLRADSDVDAVIDGDTLLAKTEPDPSAYALGVNDPEYIAALDAWNASVEALAYQCYCMIIWLTLIPLLCCIGVIVFCFCMGGAAVAAAAQA